MSPVIVKHVMSGHTLSCQSCCHHSHTAHACHDRSYRVMSPVITTEVTRMYTWTYCVMSSPVLVIDLEYVIPGHAHVTAPSIVMS